MLKGMLRKTDIVLIIFFLVIAAGFNFFLYSIEEKKGGEATVVVNIDGDVVDTYSLNKDGEYEITNGHFHNKMKIAGGQVSMIEADCRDQICIHSRPIKGSNETIVCLPNKVVIEVKNIENDYGIDAISQ